jgi:serpin B
VLDAPGGQQVTVKFMNGGPYRTASLAGWTAVRLPYRGGRLAMVALLPPADGPGCAMPAAATLGTITARLAAGGKGGPLRDVSLPRVSLGVHASMKSLLTRLGMGVAFTGAADFTGLSPQACCIGLVEQAATLQVSEKGTVASAASAVGMEATAGREQLPAVTFDRPYLMLVTDNVTGEPLFIARVANAAGQ